MSLADFLQELQTQDSIIYSQPPESAIHVIPPEKACTKIIPPENMGQKPTTVIKLKIKQKDVTTTIPPKTEAVEKPIEVIPPVSTVVDLTAKHESVIKKPPPKPQPVIQKPPPKVEQPAPKPVQATSKQEIPKEQPKEQLSDKDLFIKSGTETSKYAIWMGYFDKARASKKSNPIVDRMKVGRFTITPDNKVLLLPDYDIVGKDPDDVLKDKWF